MIRICAGKSDIKDIIKGVAVLYAVTFGLAGGIYMVYYYTYAGYWIREVLLADKKLLFFTAVSLGLLALIYMQIRRLGIYGEHQCTVELTLLGRSVQRPISQNTLQMIGGNGRRVRKGASDSQQEAGHRQNGDGQHKAPSHPLQYTKNLIFHIRSFLSFLVS